MIVVLGATGNTGSVVAQRLLDAGESVRVVSRSRERLQPLVDAGAEPAVGDLQDAGFLKETLREAAGVYALIPPKFDAPDMRGYQREVAQNVASAVRANQVPYVVTLSSYGAHLPDGGGVVSGLYPLEQHLNDIEGTHVTHLRAGYFFENFFGSIPVIKDQGVLGGFPIAGDAKMDMVWTRDIGNTAADKLLQKDFTGNNVLFLGHERSYSLDQAATILGKAIGKEDLNYVAFPADGAKQAMMAMGFSESLADQYVEFSQAASQGKLMEDNANHPKKNAETSLEDFARIFAKAYKGA